MAPCPDHAAGSRLGDLGKFRCQAVIRNRRFTSSQRHGAWPGVRTSGGRAPARPSLAASRGASIRRPCSARPCQATDPSANIRRLRAGRREQRLGRAGSANIRRQDARDVDGSVERIEYIHTAQVRQIPRAPGTHLWLYSHFDERTSRSTGTSRRSRTGSRSWTATAAGSRAASRTSSTSTSGCRGSTTARTTASRSPGRSASARSSSGPAAATYGARSWTISSRRPTDPSPRPTPSGTIGG